MTPPAPSIPLRVTADGVVLQIKVHPHARRNGIDGTVGDVLKISVTAPADQGKANQAVRELLAETFGIGVGAVVILSGQASPRKVIRLSGVPETQLRARLESMLGTERR